MSDRRKYTSLSIEKGLKETLEEMRFGEETYSEAIQDAISDEKKERKHIEGRIEGLESRLDWLSTVNQQQARLLVRMADAMGLHKNQIPRNLAEYEAWGGDSPMVDPDEATVDVFAEEKSEAHPDIDEHADHAFGKPGEEVDQYKIVEEYEIGGEEYREITYTSNPDEGIVLDDPTNELECGVVAIEEDDRDIESYYAEMEADH